MKRLTCFLLILILASLACSLTPSASSTPDPGAAAPSAPPLPTATLVQSVPTAPALAADQIRNATLMITGSDNRSRIMTFKNGVYQQGSDPAQAGYAVVTMGENIAFGDLNGDGITDAAITIAENYGGSGVFVSVVAILNNNGSPEPAGVAPVEDRAMVNRLAIQAGQIQLDATLHAPNDPLCCPSMPSSRLYRLVNNSLELISLSTRAADGRDRLITIQSPAEGAELSGPITIKGAVTIAPFENTLAYSIYKEGSSEPLDKAGFTITAADMGGPGTFELTIDPASKGYTGPLRIEIADFSAADGSTLALASLHLIIK